MSEVKIVSLDKKADEVFVSSGIAELDSLVGGFPRSRITELWGKESVGKTFLAMKLMANLSKGHKVLFIDSEYSLNKDRVVAVGADPANVDYVADSRLEAVCELLVEKVASNTYDVIILDSLALLTPMAVSDSEVGENNIGLFSRQIKHWIVKFRPQLAKSKTAFIVINQYREAIGLYTTLKPPGGTAWFHSCDLRLYLQSGSADKIVKDKEQIGQWTHVTVKKNKLGKPGGTTKFKLLF